MENETRTAILAAINATEARLRSLAGSLRVRPDVRLLAGDGDWSTRDALCHLAARSNDLPLIEQFLDRPARSAEETIRETDAANARQIADRVGRSVDDVLAEAYQGYAAVRAALAEHDDAWLRQPVPDIPGVGTVTVSDLLLMVYRDHTQWHIGTIERALDAS